MNNSKINNTSTKNSNNLLNQVTATTFTLEESIFHSVELNHLQNTKCLQKLWVKAKYLPKNIEMSLGGSPLSQEGRSPKLDLIAGKRSSKDGMVKDSLFTIAGDYLLCKDREQYLKVNTSPKNAVKGILNLRMVLAQFVKIEKNSFSQDFNDSKKQQQKQDYSNEEEKKEYSFILRLTRGQRYTEIFIRDDSEVKLWRSTLQPLAIFSDVHSNYKAGNQIGEGAFGKVFALSRNGDGAKFAIKALSKRRLLKKSGSSLKSLFLEVDIHRRMSHPNIVKLYEVQETSNSVYLVLELVEDAKPLLNLEGFDPIPFSERKQYLKQMSSVMKYMHSRGVIHRDIKPDNLIVSQEGTLKVIDFGLAMYSESCLDQFKKVGTPGFLAPELINKKPFEQYSSKVDIFALGVTYYCMVTGQHPFDGVDCEEVITNNVLGDIDLEHRLITSMEPSEAMILRGMLDESEGKRITARIIEEQTALLFEEEVYNEDQLDGSLNREVEMKGVEEEEDFSTNDENDQNNLRNAMKRVLIRQLNPFGKRVRKTIGQKF